MKRINEYKKLFNVEPDSDLKKLKTTYRNLVKEWHPDKFPNGDEQAEAGLLRGQRAHLGPRVQKVGPPHVFENQPRSWPSSAEGKGPLVLLDVGQVSDLRPPFPPRRPLPLEASTSAPLHLSQTMPGA